jgi:Double-GTPase 2
VEGLPFNECPHFGKPPQPNPPLGAVVEESDGVLLPSGDLLPVEDANRVLRRGRSRVIAIVGPREAGKTTLIASIFELFLRGPIGPFRFSGSGTLYAFERACHPSRAVSQNVVPKTERTLLNDVHFYQLVTRKNADEPIDMLLADRGGEDYRTSADDPSSARGFVEIRRADTITFLVDGCRLLQATTRSSTVSEVLGIAQALIDGDAVADRPRVAIVLTKLDEIARSADRERTLRDFANFAIRFRTLLGEQFGEVRSFEVAACPSDTSLPLGHGVDALFHYWQDEPPLSPSVREPHVQSSTRFMHQLRAVPE